MSPELSAYLDRLAHPKRRSYALAVADALAAGKPSPKTPKGLDAQTADKIARKVARFANGGKRRNITGAQDIQPDHGEGLAHLPEALRAYAQERGDTELLGLVNVFTGDMSGEVHIWIDGEYICRESEQDNHIRCWEQREQLTHVHTELNADNSKSFHFSRQAQRMSDHYHPEHEPHIIENVNVDCLDITDLEPSLAKALALKLVKWNGRGKVYSRRNGRRYLHGDIRRIDLNDKTVQALPNYSDLVSVVKSQHITAA